MKWITGLSAAGSLMVLVACGGGGPATADADALVANPVRIAGVVSTGGALVEAEVTARCAAGPLRTARSGSGGYYALDVPSDALPCVLAAVSSDRSRTLHSVATAVGDQPTVTAHITPLTELLVAQIAGAAPSGLMRAAGAGTLQGRLTPANLRDAQAAVVGVLRVVGVDPAPLSDVLRQPLVAASAVQRGNVHDKVLDALAGAMRASGATLADLVSTVIRRARALNHVDLPH